jgi:outer membrane protein, multidrug efflux system
MRGTVQRTISQIGITLSLALSLALAMAGCAVGPNYKRPAVDAPSTFRAAPSDAPATAASFGDQKWPVVFQDPELQKLIREALEKNYDVRIAATRILQAQAQLTITHSDELPSAAVLAGASVSRNAASKFLGAYNTSNNQLGLGFQWNLDFWGKYRRATEAARDQLLANQWAQQEVNMTVVAGVASAYYTLRAQDLEVQISRETLASDLDSLRLTQLLSDHGRTSLVDVRQAEQLVYGASAAIPVLEREIGQQENLISTLVGENPREITRGLELTAQQRMPEVPAGLPSSLLERRPDIREAEAQLMAANAQIGVAKAAYFPAVTLTSLGGVESVALSNLFSGPPGTWSFAAQLTQPLYAGGQLRGAVRLSEAQKEQLSLTYQQTIQRAFREVSDALIAYNKDQEFRKQQELLTNAARDASRLSNLRYRGGAASYLEVLDATTRQYSAELILAQAQLNEMLDYVELYHALGGGWDK